MGVLSILSKLKSLHSRRLFFNVLFIYIAIVSRIEIFLGCATERASPILGELIEFSACLDAVFFVAKRGTVYITAKRTNVIFHKSILLIGLDLFSEICYYIILQLLKFVNISYITKFPFQINHNL